MTGELPEDLLPHLASLHLAQAARVWQVVHLSHRAAVANRQVRIAAAVSPLPPPDEEVQRVYALVQAIPGLVLVRRVDAWEPRLHAALREFVPEAILCCWQIPQGPIWESDHVCHLARTCIQGALPTEAIDEVGSLIEPSSL